MRISQLIILICVFVNLAFIGFGVVTGWQDSNWWNVLSGVFCAFLFCKTLEPL